MDLIKYDSQIRQIEIFQSSDNQIQVEVNLDQDTVWMSQKQIAELFGIKRPAITKHLGNIFSSGELDENSVSSILEHTATDGKIYKTLFYNLDAILSVGYRVNSFLATQFRVWATKILKTHLVEGYTLNNQRLQANKSHLDELKKAVYLIHRVSQNQMLSEDESQGLFHLLNRYAYALDILDRYDHQTLQTTTKEWNIEFFRITYEEALNAIDLLREVYDASSLFGNEKDQSFESSLEAIYQTFDGKDLYPSLEEKAAHLLYFLTKNHSFSDGNKRIAAFIFIWFLEKNQLLWLPDGEKRIDDKTLVALTLMIATSNPNDKDMMIKVTLTLMASAASSKHPYENGK